MSIHIGTSGWHYPHWVERFYPAQLHRRDWLAYYARNFRCVEVNNSFYRLPTAANVDHWLAQTPGDFAFTLKASRYITHMKKLHDCAAPLDEFLARARRFGDRLAAILLQLPPQWHVNQQRLAGFLALLPADLHFAIEFRDPSWHTDATYRLLRDHAVGLCQFDLAGSRSPAVLTAGLVYVRLHGPHQAYRGSYAPRQLAAWADRIRVWDREGQDVYVFFDNDQQACAVHDALALQQQLGNESPPPPA
jgi:uncharacterized protein YecE (DUF72 family)